MSAIACGVWSKRLGLATGASPKHNQAKTKVIIVARSRNLKPNFFLNEELANCDPLARLLFAGLWCYADRDGRLEDRPKRIKAQILPYDSRDVGELLDQLAAKGFIIRYVAEGALVIQVVNFQKHQSPHANEVSLNLPAPPAPAPAPVPAPAGAGNQDSESSETAPGTPDQLAAKTGLGTNPEHSGKSPTLPSSLNPSLLNPSSLKKGPPSGGLVSDKPSKGLETPSDRQDAEESLNSPDTRPAKGKRNRDDLFNALAEVTASDPQVNGSRIGRIRKALLAADPPFTAVEVRRFAEGVPVYLPWYKGVLTLEAVQKHIAVVRAPTSGPAAVKPLVSGGKNGSKRAPSMRTRHPNTPDSPGGGSDNGSG
jgi:hypothetical protein